ncbi:MAG: glycine/betaine/sarcosine/D-proline family reductase selenoprotein B [Gammaproteobacteria bacterium]|nr:glycine/betaine/sarcosine/D-proline family reductase selenoprotein B [Gammaproteobacteria bacterium]
MSEPVRYIDAITSRYERLGYAPYRWYYADQPPPWAPLKKPLSQSRVGLLSTSGAYVVGQVAYYYKDDTSTRSIPKSTPADQIHFSHITENYLENPRKDPHCIMPLEAMRTLEQEGVIGELADDAYSCMGGVYSQRRTREETIPEVRAKFLSQNIDVALLVPM